MAKTIRKLMPTKPIVPRRRRVAAYARVSSGKDAMLHSLSAQVSYYSSLIQKNPSWQYVGVYADEAVTGTKDGREQFQRMLDDCRAGRIDMVITKSISRFARNTVTLLETVRELRTLGIDVYFEEQNIHSMSGDGELMLSILASYAQEESRSVSENCKWRIHKQFAEGELATLRFMYGYRIEKGKITIQPDEAAVVRWIFTSYLDGVGIARISRILRDTGIPCIRNGVWTPQRVMNLLKNEKYCGNALLQKRYVVDHLSKAERPNHGVLPQYFAEGTHPAIISPAQFIQTRERMEQNRVRNQIMKDVPQYSAFTGLLICENCGKKYHRKVSRTEVAWNCATYLSLGKAACHAKQIPEDILMSVTASVLGTPKFDEQLLKQRVRKIRVPSFNHLVFVMQDGTEIEREWKDKPRSNGWTQEMRAQAAEHARRRHAK